MAAPKLERSLVIFARVPAPGQVKTRLARRVGDEAAAALYAAFLDDVCRLSCPVAGRRVLCEAGELPSTALTARAAGHAMTHALQGGGDLGARMDRALTLELAGARAVCVIGSDSPTLPPALVEQAFAELETKEVVLGPSTDGGYWLIGARRPAPELFAHMPWGTQAVLPETLRRLAALGRPTAVLPFFYDVDDEDDLELLGAHLQLLDPAVAPATRRALAGLGLL